MKHTLKKIFATVSAAAMCAVPTINAFTANAATSSNPRYTLRMDFFVKSSANLDRIIFGWGLNSNGTSTPYSLKKVQGTLQRYGTGAVNYHMGGGNFYPSNSNVTGLVITEYAYANDLYGNSDNVTLYAYDKNNNDVSNKVFATPSFYVGDIDGDRDVDGYDYSLIDAAIPSGYVLNSFNYNTTVSYTLGGQTKTTLAYRLDINNDGRLTITDKYMLSDFLSIPDYHFEF